jgi:hypothetical protein
LKLLNFSPIRFDDQEITIGRLPYENDGAQVLRDLRDQHRGTHVVRREGPDSILTVPVAPEAEPIGEIETIRLADHLGLTAELIRSALLNRLAELGGTSRDYEPIEVVSDKDLLRLSCPPGIAPPDWLGLRILYEVSIRPIFFADGRQFIAAMPNVRTTRVIDRTAADLLADGISLKDVYVGRMIPRKDSRIAPRFKPVGYVRSVDGSRLLLGDFRDGAEAVEASEVWPAKDLFGTCLSHLFKQDARRIKHALECQQSALKQGPAQLERIESVVAKLRSREFELVPGVPFTFGSFLNDAAGDFPPLIPAPRPVYVFDGPASKTHDSHDQGLNTFGPYTANAGSLAAPKLCVVCQRSYKAEVEQFLHKFFSSGVILPQSRNGKQPRNYFEKAFCRKYELRVPDVQYFLTEGSSAEAYHVACQEALEQHGNGQPWNAALVQIEEAFHKLPPQCNPYLVSKSMFQSHHVPVQQFKIETTRKSPVPLSCCLNSIGLATYAKLGGTPWLMKSGGSGCHELIIGLGSAEIVEGRLGKRERFVGVTTIFGADGSYHLYNTSKAVFADRYQGALLSTLRTAIESVRTGLNWRPGDQVLLVFHAKFKKFSNKEVQAVAELIREFRQYDVKYAFLHVNERHPYMLFDTEEKGAWDAERRCTKGQYAPARGQYLRLGTRETLLSLIGPKDVKRPENGTPRPLLLSLHPGSTFVNMDYLTEQVFAFACHSWRTFLPISLPVTIQYPNLIANSLGSLSRLPWWNPDIMLGQIGKGLWFL